LDGVGERDREIRGGSIMTAAAAIAPQSAKPDPLREGTHASRLLEVFRERAEARCLLVSNGLMTLQDAVDGLQETAVAQGLLKQYGQDAIQRILSESFARWL
jgi:hypothetical protein